MSIYKHGIATKSSGAVGITQSKTTYSAQVIIGTLPINTLKNPKDAVNSIILLENSEDMDNLVGKTNEIEKYTAMQGVYASLKVHKVAPVVVINVLDPDKSQHTQAVVGKEYDVVNKMVVIEDTGVLLDKVVVSENETTYKADDDYVASINSEGYLVIALTNDGAASSLQKLNISYAKLNPDGVTAEDIIGGVDENGVRSGIELLDEVFINTGVIPAIVTAPVFSKKKEVAAALEAKVRLIGSLHNAKAYVDIDSSESGAVNVFNVAKVKEKNVPQSELIDACWPIVNKNGNVLAFSSFAAALAQAVAAENGDIPDGIDNRELLVDGVCTEDGTPVKVIQGDANSYLNATYNFTRSVSKVYDSVKFQYQNKKGKNITYNYNIPGRTGRRTLFISSSADSHADAEKKAKAQLASTLREAITASFTVMGDPKYRACRVFRVTGFGKFNGRYFIDKVTHNFSDEGYTSTIECHKCVTNIR